MLPKKLLMQINQAIEDGHREWHIERLIKENYKGTISCPTPPTIGCYIDWYEAKKALALKTGTVIEPTRTEVAITEEGVVDGIAKEHQSILDNETDISNKKDLLERLIKKCIERMKAVEKLQEMEGTTASLEAVVNHYLAEIHKMVQTQLKLSGELAEESNKQIMDQVNKHLYQLVQLFFGVVMSVAPDRVEIIKTKFYEEIKQQQSLIDVFKDQI
jgi:hypothetical protein